MDLNNVPGMTAVREPVPDITVVREPVPFMTAGPRGHHSASQPCDHWFFPQIKQIRKTWPGQCCVQACGCPGLTMIWMNMC